MPTEPDEKMWHLRSPRQSKDDDDDDDEVLMFLQSYLDLYPLCLCGYQEIKRACM